MKVDRVARCVALLTSVQAVSKLAETVRQYDGLYIGPAIDTDSLIDEGNTLGSSRAILVGITAQDNVYIATRNCIEVVAALTGDGSQHPGHRR